MPLGETLVTNGIITRQQLQTALAEQKKYPNQRIGEILVRLGYVSSDDLQSYF